MTSAPLTLLIFHNDLNIYSFVVIIMLIGIVKKNAIMMIDFAPGAAHRRPCYPPARTLIHCQEDFESSLSAAARS
jgi:hypothetical protein